MSPWAGPHSEQAVARQQFPHPSTAPWHLGAAEHFAGCLLWSPSAPIPVGTSTIPRSPRMGFSTPPWLLLGVSVLCPAPGVGWVTPHPKNRGVILLSFCSVWRDSQALLRAFCPHFTSSFQTWARGCCPEEFFFYFWSKMGKFLGIKSSSAVAHKGPHTAYALSSNQVTWSNCRNVTDIVCLAFNSLKMFKHKKRLRTFTVIFEIRMCEKWLFFSYLNSCKTFAVSTKARRCSDGTSWWIVGVSTWTWNHEQRNLHRPAFVFHSESPAESDP